MDPVGNRTSVGTHIHHPITRTVATDIKSNNIDIVGACCPRNIAIRSVYLCCPLGIRDKGNARIRSAIYLHRDGFVIRTWQHMHYASWSHHLGRFLDGSKGMTFRTIARVIARRGDIIILYACDGG